MNKDDLIGVFGSLVLTAIFTTLKLTGCISWGWLAVTAPLWFPPAVFLFLAVVYVGLDIFGPDDPNDNNETNF